jgi:cation transport ATPase
LTLTIPVLMLSMGEFVPGFPDLLTLMGKTTVTWAQFVLSTPVVLWAGGPFFARRGQSLVTHHLNMFTFISLGTGAAYFYCVVAVVVPRLFPDSFRMNGAVAIYFEAAAMITVLVPARAHLGWSGRPPDAAWAPQPKSVRSRLIAQDYRSDAFKVLVNSSRKDEND